MMFSSCNRSRACKIEKIYKTLSGWPRALCVTDELPRSMPQYILLEKRQDCPPWGPRWAVITLHNSQRGAPLNIWTSENAFSRHRCSHLSPTSDTISEYTPLGKKMKNVLLVYIISQHFVSLLRCFYHREKNQNIARRIRSQKINILL